MAKKLGAILPTVEAALHAQSTKDSTTLAEENERKRHFLTVFRRWEALFKRADRGDVQAEKWLIADYYKSLAHLSPEGMERLTDVLKEQCTFFPSIKECLEATRPKSDQFGHPFYRLRHLRGGEPALLVPREQEQKRLT